MASLSVHDPYLHGLICDACERHLPDEDYSKHTPKAIASAKTLYSNIDVTSLVCNTCSEAPVAFEDELSLDLASSIEPSEYGDTQLMAFLKNRGDVPKFVDVDGIDDPVRVTTYLKCCQDSEGKTSRDRLKRVAGIHANNTKLKMSDVDDGGASLRVGDPVCVLAHVAPKVTIAGLVMVVTHVSYFSEIESKMLKGRMEMPVSLLNHPRTIVHGTLVDLHWYSRESMICYHHTEAGEALKLAGSFVCPLNPEQQVVTTPDQIQTLASIYNIEHLTQIAQRMYDETRADKGRYQKLTLRSKFPYLDRDSRPLKKLIVEQQIASSSSSSSSSSTAPKMIACNICKKNVIKPSKRNTQITRRLNHMGWHIQFDDSFTTHAPCGLCGLETGLGKCNLVVPTRKSDQKKAWIDCKTFNAQFTNATAETIDFSLAQMSKATKHFPSTNRPVPCSKCPQTLIWSFNKEKHWGEHHFQYEMPRTEVDEITFNSEERTWLNFNGPDGKQISGSREDNLSANLLPPHVPIQSKFGACVHDTDSGRTGKVSAIKYVYGGLGNSELEEDEATSASGFEFRINFSKKRNRDSTSALASHNEIKWMSKEDFEGIEGVEE